VLVNISVFTSSLYSFIENHDSNRIALHHSYSAAVISLRAIEEFR